VNIFLTM